MIINRNRMKIVRENADKEEIKRIKKDPAFYKESVNEIRELKKILSDIPNDVDIIDSEIEVLEASFYEALASGLKRKDLAFYEKYIDSRKEYAKKLKDKASRGNSKFDKMFKKIDKQNKKLEQMRKKFGLF